MKSWKRNKEVGQLDGNVVAAGILHRRIEFLIQEAKSPNRTKDLAVIMTLRCVSNYATVNADGSSSKVKKLNSWMSRAAYDLALSRMKFEPWHKETTNEHEDELKQVWQWLVDHQHTITAQEFEARLRARPFVTVTLEEDSKLRKLKGIPLHQRYVEADIVVGQAAGLWKGSILVASPSPWTPRTPVVRSHGPESSASEDGALTPT